MPSSVKSLEHLPGLLQVGIRGDPQVVNQFLGGNLGIVAMPPDMVNHALNQVVVQFLVAVLNEAKEINIDNVLTQPPELVDGVIIHERRVVSDVLVRDIQDAEEVFVKAGTAPASVPRAQLRA